MTTDRFALPANVRRWLDHSLPSEASTPKRIINTQEGEIHVRDKWMPFTAETVYERDPFTFVWRARLKMLPGMWVIAEDGHDGEKGWGGSKLWGIIPMGSRRDPEVFRMQLVRSLAELPWMPQFALAITGLEWKDTNNSLKCRGGLTIRIIENLARFASRRRPWRHTKNQTGSGCIGKVRSQYRNRRPVNKCEQCSDRLNE